MECALFALVTLYLLRCSIHRATTQKSDGQSYSPRTVNLSRASQSLWLVSQALSSPRLARSLLNCHGRILAIPRQG